MRQWRRRRGRRRGPGRLHGLRGYRRDGAERRPRL